MSISRDEALAFIEMLAEEVPDIDVEAEFGRLDWGD